MKIIYTIGFTKKSLEEFINLLKKNNIQKLLDIRLHNSSQLSGFAKSDDLSFVLKLFKIGYEHISELAPEEKMLTTYRKSKDWDDYERKFKDLMKQRNAKTILKNLLEKDETICLLCSEDKADKCQGKVGVCSRRTGHPHYRPQLQAIVSSIDQAGCLIQRLNAGSVRRIQLGHIIQNRRQVLFDGIFLAVGEF